MGPGSADAQELGPEVVDAEFVGLVRRFRPSSMVPLVAQVAAQHMHKDSWLNGDAAGLYAPWLLAEVARVSLAHGNEHRATATLEDLNRCCAALHAIRDPQLGGGDPDAVGAFLLRATEQLEYQLSVRNEMCRTAALFVQTPASPNAKVLRPGWEHDLFGASLVDFVGAGQLLHFACGPNAGTFGPAWLDQPQLAPLVEVMDPQVLRRVWADNYVTDVPRFRAANGQPPCGPWRRFDFNPLGATPVISGLMDDGRWVVPSPGLLARRLSPLGVYHAGVRRWGNDFSDDLGLLFEEYVGRQLSQLPNAAVWPSVTYGRDHRASVDWFVVLPEVVLMVEVKSIRPTDQVRRGGPQAAQELARMLSKAFRQLKTTDDRIASGDPAFAHLAADLPRVGLVVTMENFHVVNSPFHRDMYRGELTFPALVAGAHELEYFVTLKDASPGRVLLDHVRDEGRDGWSLKSALQGRQFDLNRVLAQAWDAYPWSGLGA